MKPVQPILVVLLLLILILYFSRLRSGMLDRLAVLFFAALGITMALVPGWTVWLAHRVGVDSGAHLFMYLSILGLGFFCLLLYSRLRSLQSAITDLVRTLAVDRARTPSSQTENRPPEGDR
jgi:hypothetical protein